LLEQHKTATITWDEPPLPPEQWRPLTEMAAACSLIASIIDSLPMPLAFHVDSQDGSARCLGSPDTIRLDLELQLLGQERSPDKVREMVEARLASLVIVGHAQLEADERFLERILTSPGRPTRYDRELEPLPEPPPLLCPGCGSDDIAVGSPHERPRGASCRRCKHYFGVQPVPGDWAREALGARATLHGGRIRVLSDEEVAERFGA
jgi:hypothetical protein